MGSHSKLKKNVSAIFIGDFSTKLLSFVFVRFYTSVLTTAEYGVSDVIVATVCLLSPVLSLMINEAMTRMLLEKNGREKSYFSVAVKINVMGTLCFLALSPLAFLVGALAPYYVLFVLYYLSFALYSLMTTFARGVDHVATTAVAGVISTAIIIASNIIMLLVVKMGIVGYLLSSIIGTTVASAFIALRAKPWTYWKAEKLSSQRDVIREMLLYSLPLIPNTVSWWISNSSDRYFVTGICGAAENGIYSVAYKIPTILTTVYSIFIVAWRISAVEDFGSERSVSFFNDVYRKMSSLLYITAAGLLLFNQLLASLLYANEFYAAYVYAPVLVMSALYSGISEFYGTIYTSNRSTMPLFLTSLMGALLNILMNAILIPLGHRLGFHALGAAVATLLSYITICVIRTFDTKKVMPIRHDRVRESLSNGLLLILTALAVFKPEYHLAAAALAVFIVILNAGNVLDLVVSVLKRT